MAAFGSAVCAHCVVEGALCRARVHFLCARDALLASRAPPPFLAALSPRFAARWRRCPAARVRWRRACCLSCVLARPAAWPLSAARAVHAAKLLGADTVLRLQYAHAHALLRASRCRRGSRMCVGARVRCRVCARCVCARARSPGPGCGRSPASSPALVCVLPVRIFFTRCNKYHVSSV